MKKIPKTIQVDAYTEDDGKPVCGACRSYSPAVEHNGCADDTGDFTPGGQRTPGPDCPIWHKQDNTGAEDDQP
jgi:hypothetical protein